MTPDLLRILILVVVFAAVMLGIERLLSGMRESRGTAAAINKRLALISRGVSRDELAQRLRRVDRSGSAGLPPFLAGTAGRLERVLTGAGLRIGTTSLLLGFLIGTFGVFVLVLSLVWTSGALVTPGRIFLIAAFAVALGFGLPLLVIGRIATSRRKKLEEQFPVALDVFVRGLRAGHPVSAALELVTTEMIDPIGSEFGMVLDEITYGAELRDALQTMANRCGVEDMQMFVVSLSIQAETGGNLAEILENLAKVVRERMSMMLKVRALSSEGRMTAFILTLLPVISFVVLFISSPGFYLDVADDPYFIPAFAALLVGFGIGVFWIRKLIDLKV